MRLSVVIITFNEARNIRRCLESLRNIADEVVVLDSHSTDDTEAICKEFGVRFFQQAFAGHIEQKNAAMALAQHPWILALDADEALSDELYASIKELKAHPSHDAFQMNRLTNFCGQWIRHGSWYPDRKIRLWKKSRGQWGGQNPHDKVELSEGSRVGALKGDLLHYSYYEPRDYVQRSEKYAHIAALAMLKEGKRGSLLQLMLSPAFRFWRDWLFKGGFRDGWNGFFIAIISAYSVLLKYAYLYQQRR